MITNEQEFYTEVSMNVLNNAKVQGEYTKQGVEANVKEWLDKKAQLIRLLRNHPNWVEEAKAVVLTFKEQRNLSLDTYRSATRDFVLMLRCSSDKNYLTGDYNLLNAVHEGGCFFANKVTEDCYNYVVNRYPEEAKAIGIKVGQKMSRFMNKVYAYYGVDKHPLYNKLFAALSDSLNPLSVERTAVLSVNYPDFLLMSNGNSWSNCHTIVPRDNYQGQHKAGCLSYATDSVTMLFYTIENPNFNRPYEEKKVTRQVFFYKDGLLVQERLYPKTHDRDDVSDVNSPVFQYRQIVQDIIAKCENDNSGWEEVSSESFRITANSNTYMYHDWSNYWRFNSKLVDKGSVASIKVGGNSYCLKCGKQKTTEDRSRDEEATSLYCYDCDNIKICRDCGRKIDLRRDRYFQTVNEDTGETEYYCSECTFWCAYHDRYEHRKDAEQVVTLSSGHTYCDWGIKQEMARGRVYKCSVCGRYEPVNINMRIVDDKAVCGNCYRSMKATQCDKCHKIITIDNAGENCCCHSCS